MERNRNPLLSTKFFSERRGETAWEHSRFQVRVVTLESRGEEEEKRGRKKGNERMLVVLENCFLEIDGNNSGSIKRALPQMK